MRQGASETEFGGGGGGVQFQGRAIGGFGIRELLRGEERVAQIEPRAEFLGLLLHGAPKKWDGGGSVFVSNERQAQVQFGFVKAGLEIENLLIFLNGFRIAREHAVG